MIKKKLIFENGQMEGNIFYRDPEDKLFLEIVVARRNSIILISFIYEINVSLLFLLSTTYSSNRFNASSHLETKQTIPPTAENSTMTTRGELDESSRGERVPLGVSNWWHSRLRRDDYAVAENGVSVRTCRGNKLAVAISFGIDPPRAAGATILITPVENL